MKRIVKNQTRDVQGYLFAQKLMYLHKTPQPNMTYVQGSDNEMPRNTPQGSKMPTGDGLPPLGLMNSK